MPSDSLLQAGATQPRRRPYQRGYLAKQAIIAVKVPPDFDPKRPWDWPSAIDGGEVYARNLSSREAVSFCYIHNLVRQRRHHDTGEPVGVWMIAARFLNLAKKTYRAVRYAACEIIVVPGGRVVVGLRQNGQPGAIRQALVDAIEALDRQEGGAV